MPRTLPCWRMKERKNLINSASGGMAQIVRRSPSTQEVDGSEAIVTLASSIRCDDTPQTWGRICPVTTGNRQSHRARTQERTDTLHGQSARALHGYDSGCRSDARATPAHRRHARRMIVNQRTTTGGQMLCFMGLGFSLVFSWFSGQSLPQTRSHHLPQPLIAAHQHFAV